MKIGDYKQMMAYLTRPEQPKEQVAYLVDELTPGPLKDELTKDYDPSQESYEEYLQRKALGERPFNAQDGGRANLYAGGSLEKFASQIKDLHLKGISADKINEILKFEKDRSTTIDELIRSMIRGDAPITINAEELKRRPNLLGANKTGTPADRQEALKAYVDNFKKKNNRLPSKKELENAKFDFGTITKAVKSGNIEVLPSGQFLSMVKSEKGKQDILELSKDPEIRNIFKTGQFDTVNTINKVKEVLGDPNMSDNVAGTKIHTLAKYFSGEKSMKGINPTFRKNAELITEKFPYKEALRELGEIKIGESVGEQSLKTMKENIRGGDFYSKAGLSKGFNIDEAQGISSTVNRGTTPYGIFGQIIGTEQNTKDKLIWDARKSKLEAALQEALASDDQKQINQAVRNFNNEAKQYEEKLNAKRIRGAKKITLPKVSLASPDETIANFKNFNNTYKKAFTDNFKQKGYSFIIPKDLKTLPELRDEVNDPKSSTYKKIIGTLKKGFNEFDEKKLFDKINKSTPDALKKIIKTIPRIASLEEDFTGAGGYPLTAGLDSSIGVQPVEEDKSFVERNPITTGATVAASPLLTKTGRKVYGKLAKPLLSAMGSVPVSGYFAYDTIKNKLAEGKTLADAITEPEVGLELLYPELFKRAGLKFLNPLVKVSTPVGASITTGGTLKKRAQEMMKQAEGITALPEGEEQRRLIEEYAAKDYRGYETGGRVGFADGPKDPGKRKTMKILAGLGSLPILGRFFDVAQVAEKAAPAVVETFKNAPAHFIGLVNKIRALGKIVDPKKLLRSEQDRYSNVYDYGEYRMFERPDGQVEIGKQKLVATEYGDGIVSEEYMSYDPKSPKFNKKGEKIEGEYDEVYEENTTYADQYGEMQDVREGIEPETINDGTYSKEELEQLIIEQIEDSLKKGKK
jgi:hypothetical protein